MAIKSGKKWLVFGLMLWLLGLLLLAAPLLAVAFSILPAHSGLALLCVVWLPAESIIVEGRRNLSKFVHRIPTNVSAIVYLRSFRDDGKSLAPRKEVDDFYQFRLASSIFNRALLAIGVLILDILKIP